MRYITFIFLSLTIFFNAQSQSLDLDFGDNGITFLDNYAEPGYEMYPIFDASGQIVLAGLPSPSFTNSKVFVTKFNLDGTTDLDFGEDGFVEYDLGEGFVAISDFIQLDNGNLVIAGTSFQDGWLIMFDSQGNLVTTFGDNGFFDTQISADNNMLFITQVDDRMFCLHRGTIGGSAYLATSYYNMDGSYDTDYGTDGTILYSELGFNSLRNVSWDFDNNGAFKGVYFSGYNPGGEDVAFVGTVSADGVLNNEFGDGGLFRLSGANFISDIALDNDGKLLLSAGNSNNYVIQKLDNQGELVTDFGFGGSYIGTWSLPIRNGLRIIPTADGGFLHSGSMDAFSVLKSVFQKHNENGSVDETIGEIVYDDQAVFPSDMLHSDNGDIYIFGLEIVENSNLGRMFVIKYTSDITDVENLALRTITLSPNPNRETNWTIDINTDVEIAKAELLGVSGSNVFDLEIDQNKIYTYYNVDSGLYILSITTTKGEIVNTQVVVAE